MDRASSISLLICSFASKNASLLTRNISNASCRFAILLRILSPVSFIFISQLNPTPPQRVQGRPSPDFPVPLHCLQGVLISVWRLPFPPQTIHGTLAPKGFLPDPAQNLHFIKGSSTSTTPVPLQTKQCEIVESRLYGSLPEPLQN